MSRGSFLGEFKRWEIVLLALASLLLIASASLYFSGVSLRKTFLGWPDERASSEQVGRLATLKGDASRQLQGSVEFESIQPGAPLFNFDTVVTGPGTSASIKLDDGGVIDLGPNTMVKLTFDSKLSLGGISRAANVEVVTGQVSGKASRHEILLKSRGKTIALSQKTAKQTIQVAPPPRPVPRKPRAVPIAAAPSPVVPPPVPRYTPPPPPVRTVARFMSPGSGIVLRVPNGSLIPQKMAVAEWTVTPPKAELQIRLLKRGEASPVDQVTVVAIDGKGHYSHLLKQPGSYSWELRMPGHDREPPIAVAKFSLSPEFEAIRTLEPLVGGRKLQSNHYRADVDNFDITLRWEPYPGATKYKIGIYRDRTARRALALKTASGTELVLNRNKVYSGQIYWRVVSRLPSGFLVYSPPTPFEFNFLAPALTLPANHTHLSRSGPSRHSVLLTWQKTTFTQSYQIEVASDPSFRSPRISRKVKENFFLLELPPAGTYYWRVRSFANGAASPSSKPFELVVTP